MSEYVYIDPQCDTDYKEGGYADFYNKHNAHEFFPWDEDGYLIVARGFHSVNYEKLWNLDRFKPIDLRTLIADFYLLDAVASCTLVPGNTPQVAANPVVLLEMIDAGFYARNIDSPEGVALEAAIAFSRHTINHADLIRDYMQYAMASEIQYHEVGHPIGDSWSYAVRGWYHVIEKFGHELASKWMVSMFDRDGWASGFGGQAWKGIADVAYAYERGEWMGEQFGPREFLDRAFSLQHNGGTMFNKCNWANSVSNVQKVLDAHANSDWKVLHNHASESTRNLVGKYLTACGIEDHNVFLGIYKAPTPTPTKAPKSNSSAFTPSGKTYTSSPFTGSLSKGMVIEKGTGGVYGTVQSSGKIKTTIKSMSAKYYWSGDQYNTSYVLDNINSGKWTLYTGFGTEYIITQPKETVVVDPEFEKLLKEEEEHEASLHETAKTATHFYTHKDGVQELPLKAGDIVAHKHSFTDSFWPITVTGWEPCPEGTCLKYTTSSGLETFEAGWTPANALKWLTQGTWVKSAKPANYVGDYPVVKVMQTKFDGSKCKLSGDVMNAGDPIVYHGKGNGASSLTAWLHMFGPLPHDAKVTADIPSHGLSKTTA